MRALRRRYLLKINNKLGKCPTLPGSKHGRSGVSPAFHNNNNLFSLTLIRDDDEDD